MGATEYGLPLDTVVSSVPPEEAVHHLILLPEDVPVIFTDVPPQILAEVGETVGAAGIVPMATVALPCVPQQYPLYSLK